MQMPDAEVGHILTNLSAMSSRPEISQYSVNAILTPSSSAPTPSQNHNAQPISPPGSQSQSQSQSQTQSGLKRSRSRPTKSCEECRRKKLKCDRELPCSNCKKGGRDGSTCVFKDGPATGSSEDRTKKPRVEEGQFRTSFLVSREQGNQGEVDRYPNVPYLTRNDPVGPGRGLLAYGMRDFAPSMTPDREWRNEEPAPVEMSDRGRAISEVRDYRPVRGILAHGETDYAPKAAGKSWGNEEPSPMSWGQGDLRDESARALGKVHVKGSRSRYIGIGDRMAVLDHFQDSKNFILGSIKDPETSGMIRELIAYQDAFQPKHKPDHTIPHDRDQLIVEMMKVLPSGLFFGALQSKYLTNWETIWRVLHIPTFMKECDQITQIRGSGSFTLPPHIRDSVVPQILAILSTASRLHDPNDRSSTTERLSDEQILKNLQLIRNWLDGLHGKALVNLHTLQTRTLLLIARQANLATPSELWVESGNLVRNAMIMGLHQDPEPWDEISKFDKEMRRKLWMTIVELDLQFSLGAGMPSALSVNSFNVREPINVDDHDLSEDMTEYPPSKPLTIWTHALPQIALGASLQQRLHIINALGGNLNLSHSAPTLLQHASLLEKALLNLPSQFRSSTRAGNNSNKRLYRLFTSIMIDVSIRRPLMTLYRVISMSPLSSRYPEARKGALRNALATLSHLDALDPSVADLNIVKSREYLNLFHILRKNDILQAALILCYEIKLYNSSPHPSQDLENSAPEEEFPQTQYSLTRVVENTLNGLLGRLGEWGSDLKDLLHVSVVLQTVRSDGSEAEKRELMRGGADRVLEACRRVRPDVRERFREEGNSNSNENAHRNAGWNGDLGRPQGEGQNGGMGGFDGFNMILDDDLSFENLDSGFFDWGMSQSWL